MSIEKPPIPTNLRLVKEAGEPLGLFFRPGRDDHTVLKQLLSEGPVGMSGAVFDPCHCEFQEELRAELTSRDLEAVLDPGMMELATVAGYTQSRRRLPWADAQPHRPFDFNSAKCDAVANQIAKFVAEKRYTAVFAPTHFLSNGPKDEWFDIDLRLASGLRQRLDENGCSDVSLYYPLAIPMRTLSESSSRVRIKAALGSLRLDAVWLRVHPFGSESGDTTLRRYINASHEMQGLQVPLIAEKTGVLGLALLAFGAVAGLESGISAGEKFDYGRLKRLGKPGKKFARSVRVYLADLGAFLTRQEATQLFSNRGLRQFGCKNTACCRNGVESMLKDPRRHLTQSRMIEVAGLSRVTPTLRASEYLEHTLRPATDNLARVLANAPISDALKAKLEKNRRKQDGWRATLGQMARSPIRSFSRPIERRIQRVQVTA
jgi:hypothetical protein